MGSRSDDGHSRSMRPAPPAGSALVLVCHGTRLPAGRAALGRLAASVRSAHAGPVLPCFVDVQPPTPLRVLTRMPREEAPTLVVPALLSTGFHVKVDIPDAVAAAGADVRIARALGPSGSLAAVMADLVREELSRTHGTLEHVVLAAAGSSDPAAAVDVGIQCSLLSEALGGAPVSAAFATGSGPSIRDALSAHGRGGLVANYLLAPGFFADRAAAAAEACGAASTPPLLAAGADALRAVRDLVLQRAEEAAQQ